MRRMTCDEFEFDSPGSGQFLELAFSSPRQHRELKKFLEECGASATFGWAPEPGWGRWETIREHLRRFAGLELPYLGKCREVVVLREEWDELAVGIAEGSNLIWYHWTMSA